MTSSRVPRLTVGLPTYNGESYLAAAVDSLLAQTYEDFELLISDNASTDATEAMCRAYAEADERVRYVRHPQNRGSAFNHNYCIEHARGELFKWASDDDEYAPDLLERCVAALDARPECVLAHAWTSVIDENGVVVRSLDYTLDTDVPDARTRFRSLLYLSGGDDIYGVIRMPVLRRLPGHGSYHQADRVFTARLSLWGRFHQVPDHLYLRREHPQRTSRSVTKRERSARLDPRRSHRWRHPLVRLMAEYLAGYVAAIVTAPLPVREKLPLLGTLFSWFTRRAADPDARSSESRSPVVP